MLSKIGSKLGFYLVCEGYLEIKNYFTLHNLEEAACVSDTTWIPVHCQLLLEHTRAQPSPSCSLICTFFRLCKAGP